MRAVHSCNSWFHLNTRSIRNKIDYIQGLTESYHILSFSETHLDDNVDTFSLKIYSLVANIKMIW